MIFVQTSGRFKTRLLWIDEVDLQNDYFPALAQLYGLLTCLRRDQCLGTAYRDSINEFIHQETVEEVTDETLDQLMDSTRTDLYFLPHRAVYDLLRISTKCQVVFDASAKTKSGKSFNDCCLLILPSDSFYFFFERCYILRGVKHDI